MQHDGPSQGPSLGSSLYTIAHYKSTPRRSIREKGVGGMRSMKSGMRLWTSPQYRGLDHVILPLQELDRDSHVLMFHTHKHLTQGKPFRSHSSPVVAGPITMFPPQSRHCHSLMRNGNGNIVPQMVKPKSSRMVGRDAGPESRRIISPRGAARRSGRSGSSETPPLSPARPPPQSRSGITNLAHHLATLTKHASSHVLR